MFLISNIIERLRNKQFLAKDLRHVQHFNLPPPGTVPLHIITVTYNNDLLIDHQVRLLEKYVKDKFVFIVADNSSDPEKRAKIEEKCRKMKLAYISLPTNPYKTGSNSHGLSLNWMFSNYVRVKQPLYFGFIDHDLYPFKEHSLIQILQKQKIYGAHQGNDRVWFLWPGFCFFSYSVVKDIAPDFLPGSLNGKQVDTGGRLWYNLYSGMGQEKIKFPGRKYISLREGEIVQSDKMEVMGEWLHSINGSYWMEVNPKENELFDYLYSL